MAHYAYIDDSNIVVTVIVGKDENEIIDGLSPEDYYAKGTPFKVIRTSYNGKIRKNYAGIGYYYDELLDAFIPPKPYESWILDLDKCNWKSPIDYPSDEQNYYWNESEKNWIRQEI